MNDGAAAAQAPLATAGAMLRAARERAGMHIGVLATTLKVPVRKLELLENDRFDELPDATFTRALAMSVCRVLKCDPAPVLAALPRPQQGVVSTLEQVTRGMNAPMSARVTPGGILGNPRQRSAGWAAVVLVLLAALWWVLEPDLGHWGLSSAGLSRSDGGAGVVAGPGVAPAAPAGQAASPVLAASSPGSESVPAGGVVHTVHGSPSESGAALSSATSSAISVSEPSWIEASDLQGRPLWTRTLTPGEVVALEGHSSLRLTIGNAAGTQVRWRGQVVDLVSVTRDNVARLELK